MEEKSTYKVSVAAHFLVTFLLVSFAIVSLVQGIKMQFDGSPYISLAFYFATPIMVFVSYVAYKQAHYKLGVLALSRN